MPLDQYSAQVDLPEGPRRRARAEEWLGAVLKEWAVRSAMANRWLSSAEPALEEPGDLVLFVQYDAALSLFTLEIWREGDRIFGIDDWVG